ncbi:MAG TPA: hypothetical protein VFS60_07505, partial [Thermoanaerobaculia bacterium]|nr:hypothetical protein [Thermoanaerobaculia bacterium]
MESLARRGDDSTLWSDLAAAYEVRAQRRDRPADWLPAFAAAQRAIAAKPPGLPAARFNLALAEEALGLVSQALRSWEAVAGAERGSPWGREAEEHRRRLEQALARRSASQWPRNLRLLADAVRAG